MPARSQPELPLADWQRAIAGTLMRPLARGERMQRAAAETATRLVKSNDRLTAFDRLQIYNQQYWWRLMGSMQEDFRGLRAVLGERKFERLAIAYLEACGSTSWNLRDLGQALESFARQHPELTAPQTPLALDMIRVEWARVIAFDGPEKPRLEPEKLGRNPEQLRLDLQPYITLLELTHPIDRLLGKLRQRHLDASAASNAVSAQTTRRRALRLKAPASREPIYLAVHRVDLVVYFKRLEPGAFRLLSALRAGETLANACETAFDGLETAPEENAKAIQSWFTNWMRLGWLVRR